MRHTCNMLSAALNGDLQNLEYYVEPIFGFEVPTSCPNVPEDVLYPSRSWPSRKEYDQKYRQLAARFIDNFKKFSPDCPPNVIEVGPKI